MCKSESDTDGMINNNTMPNAMINNNAKPSRHNGECFCVECNVFMGHNNPRQLCDKIYCNNIDIWYTYDDVGIDDDDVGIDDDDDDDDDVEQPLIPYMTHDPVVKQVYYFEDNVWKPAPDDHHYQSN